MTKYYFFFLSNVKGIRKSKQKASIQRLLLEHRSLRGKEKEKKKAFHAFIHIRTCRQRWGLLFPLSHQPQASNSAAALRVHNLSAMPEGKGGGGGGRRNPTTKNTTKNGEKMPLDAAHLKHGPEKTKRARYRVATPQRWWFKSRSKPASRHQPAG